MIKQAIEKIIKDEFDLVENVNLQKTKNISFGNLTTNICFQIAKKVQKRPDEVFKTIKENLKLDKYGIEKLEFVSGFINIFLDDSKNNNVINSINNSELFSIKESSHKTFNIEFVSANPTGFLHIGHARNACVGDVLARILTFLGHKVTREYYMNDAGNQIHNLTKSLMKKHGMEVEESEGMYKGDDISVFEKEIIEHNPNFNWNDFNALGQKGMAIAKEYIEKHLKELGIKDFDIYFSEQSIIAEDKLEAFLNMLDKKGLTKVEDGALWALTQQYGDEKDRVMIKKDKSHTYFATDACYHQIKANRKYDILIDLWGADHHGYAPRILALMKALGYNNFHILFMQMVKLVKNGQEFKMSKREGTVVTIKDMLNLVGKDALRYFLLSRALNQPIEIDIELASSKSNENPIFYIQYAHARINQILEKNESIIFNNNIEKYDLLVTDKEKELVQILNNYIDTLKWIETNLDPYKITQYLYELATKFHAFYNETNIINSDEKEKEQRINLVRAVKSIIHHGLNLLGIEAMDKM